MENRVRRPHKKRQRSWTLEQIKAVQRLRENHPRWGKEKLTRLLPTELVTSVSTVGRILSYLRDREVVKEAQTGRRVEDAPRRAAHRSRSSRPYAIRKRKGYVAQQPGDLVQVDTLDIRPVPGVVLKQFTASDVVSCFDVLEVHRRATASLASQFLETLVQRMPIPVRAMQVDGGSEFYAEFEEAWTVSELTPQLWNWEKIYNEVRPHQILGYLTPAQFISNSRIDHPLNEEKGTADLTPTVPSPS